MMSNGFSKETSFLKTLFETSLTSMLVSLPILVWHFYEFSIVSLIANMFFVPFYSLIVLPAAIFTWVLQFVDDKIFIFFTNVLSKILIFSEHVVTHVSS